MADIFISYAREDIVRVTGLVAALRARGWSVWWDQEIRSGEVYAKHTQKELEAAKVVVAVWSKASVESNWVKDEAEVARDRGTLAPVSLDGTAPPLGFRQFQCTDLSPWSGEGAVPDMLVATIAAHLGEATAPQPAPRAPPSVWSSSQWSKRALAAAAILLMIGVGAVGLVMAPKSQVSDHKPGDRSIAVLPFENRSQTNTDSEYGDWLSELISGLLGKTSDLRVISQSSAAVFKNKAVAMPEIARQLGVTLVLAGSVRSEGDDIVISAQLIDAAADTQVWAEIYERKTDNALGVQSEVAAKVAAAVAGALNVTIAQDERQALDPTANPKAFEAYRNALKLYRTTTEANVRSAQRLLNEAVELDPNFAVAWALLARVHSYFYFNQTDATEGRRAAAEQALGEALRLKPHLAEVLLADAYFEYWVKRDYEGARARFEKLSDKWPNNSDVLTALASITRRQGRWDESKTYFERAVAIDPLRPGRRVKAAEANFATRDFEGALRQIDASLAHWPEAPDSLPFIARKALVYQALGRLDEAGGLLKGVDPDGELVQPIVYQAMLRRRYDEAIPLLEDMLNRDQAEGSVGRTSIDLNLYLGDLRRLAGDAKGAETNYREARDELRVELANQPESADIHSYLALAYSGLGDRAGATRHAALAVETVPITKDALSGVYYLDVQARVWARLGDRDAAIPAIATLMKLPANLPLTPALLRLDPDFEELRTDPRFTALLNGVP